LRKKAKNSSIANKYLWIEKKDKALASVFILREEREGKRGEKRGERGGERGKEEGLEEGIEERIEEGKEGEKRGEKEEKEWRRSAILQV
jgi:hypothetical protein